MSETRDMGERMREAMEQSLIDVIRKGDWLAMDYSNRVRLDATLVRDVYTRVDKAKVIDAVLARAEQHMADSIFSAMATEITTDVKQILSNRELREDVRAILRERIRAAAAGVSA